MVDDPIVIAANSVVTVLPDSHVGFERHFQPMNNYAMEEFAIYQR